MRRSHNNCCTQMPILKVSALAIGLTLAGAANAEQFKFDNGISGSLDTTISAGVSVRLGEIDKNLIGIANGGTSRSVNEDDGDRSFAKNRPFSELLKVTQDLEFKYQDWGFFARGLYFVDFKTYHNENIGPTGKKIIGKDAKILDAFVTKSFEVADRKLRFKVGNQVISWGESTFIGNSINVINALDVTKLRTPGSEIKEALLPTTALSGSFELTKNASLEAYAQFNHDKFRIDPRGSYWSNGDAVADDATEVIFSFGRRKDLFKRGPTNIIPPTSALFPLTQALGFGAFDPAGAVWAKRLPDREASDSGQYGFAFRYLATDFNNTEFGLYALKYHSRTPLLSAIRGTPSSILTSNATTAGASGQTGTIGYFAEYPKNIRLYGVSFNTQGPAGVALQGELSYRPNQPLQLASGEVILAAVGLPNLITGYQFIPGTVSAANPYGVSPAGLVAAGTEISGFRRVKMAQFQMTGTKTFPSVFGADQAVALGEFGYTKYIGLPGDQKFAAAGAGLPATQQGADAGQAGSVQPGGYLTANSWGYRVVGSLTYSNALLGGNLTPRMVWSHDVHGSSQTFNSGVKAVSLGANLEFNKKLTFDVGYSNFFGGKTFCGTDTVDPAKQTSLAPQVFGVAALGIAGQGASWCTSANPVKDRDFYSVSVSYSF